jgi:hypothetical protein
MAIQYPHIRVDIYESDDRYPVVSHIFYGKTLKEAQRYFNVHMRTDEFLYCAIKKGQWKDLILHTEIKTYG